MFTNLGERTYHSRAGGTAPTRHVGKLSQKACVDGPQVAFVVGPEGEEIHCDEHGRVKVQFPWNRYAEPNDTASCWVRVAQGWAGAQVASKQLARNLSITMVVAFVHPDNDGLYLERDDATRAQHRRWRRDMQNLSQSQAQLTGRLSLPMSPGARANTHRDIARLEQEQRALALNEPKRFTAGGGSQASAGVLADLGLGELREQHRQRLGKATANAAAVRQRMQRWVNARGIGGLPLLIAAINLANVTNTLLDAEKDGVDREEMTTLASQASYATAAVMSLWVMPYWQLHAKSLAPLRGSMISITGAGISAWKAAGQSNVSRIAAKLATRVAGLAAFAAIGAGVETWQIAQQYGNASGDDERVALIAKGLTTTGMAIVGGAQLFGAAAGRRPLVRVWLDNGALGALGDAGAQRGLSAFLSLSRTLPP